MTEVLPYYSLKQRRQELGFEGPDIEVKKRRDILKRSKSYTREDIEEVDDGLYLVRSQSDPSKVYEVDIDTYTCTCLDFPLICFCKHICAVQMLFDEPTASPPLQSSSTLPSLSRSLSPSLSSSDVATIVIPKRNPLTLVAEKLERLASRLRHPRKKNRSVDLTDLSALPDLEAALDAMMIATDNGGSVLPSAKHLAPVVKDSTARQQMMPNVKTRRVPTGDVSYGAGASSGNKARAPNKKARMEKSTPSSTPSSSSAPASTALNPTQPQPHPIYYPPHPYPPHGSYSAIPHQPYDGFPQHSTLTPSSSHTGQPVPVPYWLYPAQYYPHAPPS